VGGLLFVHGDDGFARRVFNEQEEGYWSQALPLVLEKHGILDFTVSAEPGRLTDSLEAFDAVLVARLPEKAWNEELIDRLVQGDVPVLVEGPLTEPLEAALGARRTGVIDNPGYLAAWSSELGWLAAAYGLGTTCSLTHHYQRPVRREEALYWARQPVPITEAQARAWRAEAWRIDRWELSPAAELIAEWVSSDRSLRFPVIARRGSLIGCALDVFSLLGRRHTSEPYEHEEWRTAPRCAGLEAILLGLIDLMYRARGVPRARVLPWPHPATWTRNVRHDFDRPLSAEETARNLAAHARLGTRATWYWRPRHVDSEALKLVAAAPGHEIALHTEHPWTDGETERSTVEEATGQPMRGTAAHGAPDCFGYQGAPNVIWADDNGFVYTELIQHAHLHPHRFAGLEPDGRIRTREIICLPHHQSFDRSTRPGDTFEAESSEALPMWRDSAGFLQVMNHPDLNFDELFRWLDAMPSDGCLDWTAAEAADWWRRTHVAGALTVRRNDENEIEVRSGHGVERLAVELLYPDGTRAKKVIDLGPGESTAIEPYGAQNPAVPLGPWDEVGRRFATALHDFYECRGEDPSSAANRLTIDQNSTFVPRRGDTILRLLSGMAGIDLAGRRLLDAGCGFGALSVYLATKGSPAEVVAVDPVAEQIALARDAISGVDSLEDRLRFLHGDLRSLDELEDDRFDVVTAIGVMMFLTSGRDLRRALSELRRVLAPGGILLFQHANRWQRVDPFSGRRYVHLLPRRRQRMRLLSAPRLRRELSRVGLETETIWGWDDERRHTAGFRRYVGKTYTLVARRPAG
jgi:SAM-dependent methyltransferase